MGQKFVLLTKSDYVATITLNRPEKLNAFSGKMREDILSSIEDVAADPNVRVVVITGAGKAFCVGGDVNEFVDGTSQAFTRQISSRRPDMNRAVLAITTMEKPVIASVNGAAAGGGCNLALACDIRIAAENARFGQVFTRRGLHPDWGGIYLLPMLVGYARAAELIFSGEVIDAKTALQIGMVNYVVPNEVLSARTDQIARRIADNAPLAIAFAKRGLQKFYRWNLEQALDYETYVQQLLIKSEDVKEGFSAFLEKRDPVFKGR